MRNYFATVEEATACTESNFSRLKMLACMYEAISSEFHCTKLCFCHESKRDFFFSPVRLAIADTRIQLDSAMWLLANYSLYIIFDSSNWWLGNLQKAIWLAGKICIISFFTVVSSKVVFPSALSGVSLGDYALFSALAGRINIPCCGWSQTEVSHLPYPLGVHSLEWLPSSLCCNSHCGCTQ